MQRSAACLPSPIFSRIGGRRRPSRSGSGREDLGEGADVENVVAAIEAVQGGLWLAVVAEQAVRIVLADEHLVLPS